MDLSPSSAKHQDSNAAILPLLELHAVFADSSKSLQTKMQRNQELRLELSEVFINGWVNHLNFLALQELRTIPKPVLKLYEDGITINYTGEMEKDKELFLQFMSFDSGLIAKDTQKLLNEFSSLVLERVNHSGSFRIEGILTVWKDTSNELLAVFDEKYLAPNL